MSENIIMPQLGETVAEGKIVSWFKKIGDAVVEGDRLFEVETDKVTIDVEAVVSGTITSIHVGDGETAAIGTVVAVLNGASESAPPATGGKRTAATSATTETATTNSAPARVLSVLEEVATPVGHYGSRAGIDGLKVTPLARRLLEQSGVDVEMVVAAARGRNGSRIFRSDVEAAMATAAANVAVLPAPARREPAAPTTSPPASTGDIVTLNTIRQRTGERLTENWRNIPHVFQAVEVDFTAIEKARSVHKARFKTETGLSLTYLPFISRATTIALREFPLVNARFDGKTLIRSSAVHLGIAVDLAHNGLVVPVIRDADGMTVAGLARALGRLVEQARAGHLGVAEMTGGTYSISNNGAFGTLFTTPIINAPQVAILSTDAIRLRPAVVSTDVGDMVVPRLMGMVGQSFDHRAFDGAYSAAFLSHLKTILEQRDWMQELA